MQRKRQLRSTGLLCCLLLFTAVMAGAEEVPLTSGSTGNINTNPIKITAAGTYTIEGTGTTTTNAITVELPNTTDVADITIKNVHIERTGDNECPFDIAKGTVNLTLEEENILKAGRYKAGLQVANDNKLVITQGSTGTLTAQGGRYAAGIGGSGSGGTITIEGGTVTAKGGDYGASIGGGYRDSGGTITIEGGTVTAQRGYAGGGIGGGYDGSGGTVTITGGIIDTPSLKGGTCRILGGTLVCQTIPVTA